MALTCPKCSRVNPGEAQYCFHDGSPLGNQARAGGARSQNFATPFVFPSGQACHNFDQLALACVDNWPTACDFLQQGYLANFFGGIGRADLALAAKEAARSPDRDQGLDQLLTKLPTQAIKPPQLQVEPTQVNLGVQRVGQDTNLQLRLTNLGMGLMNGSVSCEGCEWLSVGDGNIKRKLFQFLHEGTIPVHVRGKNLRTGNKPIEGKLTVESNGGTVTVVVRADVPVIPFPDGVLAGAKSPRQIAEKAKASPKEAAALFEKGTVAQWYTSNGWTYPVPGPSASGVAAVQQFFEALGLTAPPKLEINQQSITLHGSVGEQVTASISVSTSEKRHVYAHAVCDKSWLVPGKAKFDGNRATIPLTVRAVPNCPGETLRASLTVTGNGNQRFTVPVSLTVSGRSRGGSSPVFDVLEIVEEAPSKSRRSSEEVVVAEMVEAVPMPKRPSKVRRLEPEPDDGGRRGKKLTDNWTILAILPIIFLMCGLGGTLGRDLLVLVTGRPPEGPGPGGGGAAGTGEQLVTLKFHDADLGVSLGEGGVKPEGGGKVTGTATWEPSMRFGVLLTDPNKRRRDGFPYRLNYEEQGLTNNAVVKVDGFNEWIFGERPFHLPNGQYAGDWPGRWEKRQENVGGAESKEGRKSLWYYDNVKLRVIQTVEIVPGVQSGNFDTVLVRYRMENLDNRAHNVGLRFLLDTYIGDNDGVPFLIPGQSKLIDTQAEFSNPKDIPDFIQARESQDLRNPGLIVQVGLKLQGLDPPDRVTLGAWPNPALASRNPQWRECKQEKTLWTVPMASMQTINPADSAVVIYWNERQIAPNKTREVGFTYGLGQVAGGEGGGKLAVTVGGDFTPGGEFTVTAYVSNPTRGQNATLELPAGFTFSSGDATQTVPAADAGTRTAPVTWKVRGPRSEGSYNLVVRSGSASQTQPVKIRAKGIFGN